MQDAPPGCAVTNVTQGSAADDAGLRLGDLIIAMDGAPTGDCNALKAHILAHAFGDTIRLDLRRGIGRMVIQPILTTRAEVLHRQFVGRTLDSTDVRDGDNGASYDLGDQRGPLVIGWFDIHRCAGCAAVFDRLDTRLRARLRDGAPRLLAVTAYGDDISALRKAFASSVPIALADSDNPALVLAHEDGERVYFMVVDNRGTVRFVTPIVPDADDIDAALDEVLAAAEQAEHARRR